MTTMVERATPERWDDLVTIMGTRGDSARCWCQFFILRRREMNAAAVDELRERLRAQVLQGDPPPGVLAYVDDQPVGWCAVAPKTSYPRLQSSPVAGSDTDGVWSVSCFVVRVGYRRQGVATALLRGAVDLARSAGATSVEGYAVDPSARASVSSAELYHGTLGLFLAAGFTEVARPYASRARVRYQVVS